MLDSLAIDYVKLALYLDFQHVIAADATIVHLVIRIVSITAAFVFYKGKADRNMELTKALVSCQIEEVQLTDGLKHFAARECRSVRDVHNYLTISLNSPLISIERMTSI